MPNPPFVEQMEVEIPEAATTNYTEASDSVMAEDNVEPEVNDNAKANANSEANIVVPPPRPHTMELARNTSGELVAVKWPVMIPPAASGPRYTYHVEQWP